MVGDSLREPQPPAVRAAHTSRAADSPCRSRHGPSQSPTALLPPDQGHAAVILQEPNQTPFDLRWRMLGTDIRVHPFFWILALFLGWYRMPGQDGPTKMLYLALWVACVFVSVLLHEFGHVLMGRL